jgi:hypothetical protein
MFIKIEVAYDNSEDAKYPMLHNISCMHIQSKDFYVFVPIIYMEKVKATFREGATLTMALRFKYTLTKAGESRCTKSEFYLQDTLTYKGYTERIFRSLHGSDKALTVREISQRTGIRTRSVNGVITFNIYAGYIKRIFL